MKNSAISFLLVGGLHALVSFNVNSATSQQVQSLESAEAVKPNILMILVDDLGYTDLGTYGGNIETKNIDQLANTGFRFSNAHAYPTCAPSRASLMTGQSPHRVGMGGQNGMTPPGVSSKAPGYSGSLEGDFVGIARLLHDNGYRTYQSGKWHLGDEEHQLPMALGFEKHFSLLDGAASHYQDMLPISLRVSPSGKATYMRNGEIVHALPEGFYSTKNYTNEIITMIDADKDDERPFFAYLAYTAVHDPLHAPEQYIEKYSSSFDKGFEKLRQDRIDGLKKHGLITDGSPATAWLKEIPDWGSLTSDQKADLSRRMAVYAAMLDYMDQQIGRLIDYLKKIGEYDNTLIVVASDNGAAGTPKVVYTLGHATDIEWQNVNYFLKNVSSYGRPGSFPTMGLPNAQASSGPYHSFKTSLHEGGTRIPLILKLPDKKSGAIVDTFFHLSDLYPTFAEYAQIDVSGQHELQGISFKSYLESMNTIAVDREFGMEYMGLRAYRDGEWKLLFIPEAAGGTGDYALYNLTSDPGETRDLSQSNPELVTQLSRAWFDYASRNNVIVVPMSLVNKHYEKTAPIFLSIDWGE